jgi:hypothetical protein
LYTGEYIPDDGFEAYLMRKLREELEGMSDAELRCGRFVERYFEERYTVSAG